MENNIPKQESYTAGAEKSSLKKALDFLHEDLTVEKIVNLQDDIFFFAQKLREKYPNFKNYTVYHTLIGSTIPAGVETVKEDFPGEDSVEDFVNSLIKKYRKE